VFHFGVLLRLAYENRLESIAALSTVSGGSIAIGAIFSGATPTWPTSIDFVQTTYPRLKALFTGGDLFSARNLGLVGLIRYNARLLHDRAAILADRLREQWGIVASLADLPESPSWWINCTTYDTGKNWRFARREMGDWVFGRHYDPRIPLSTAIAASAAVPYVIGSLRLSLPTDGWYVTDPATRRPLHRKEPQSDTVRLWDGGVYENMGLEALYKPGQQSEYGLIVASDASGAMGPPTQNPLPGLLSGHLATPRLFDIGSDQNRALRSRIFMRDVVAGTVNGLIVRMGQSTRDIHIKGNVTTSTGSYDPYLRDAEVSEAFRYPVDLAALSEASFDLIARHGFEATDATLHRQDYSDRTFLWPSEGS
jgi:NTE family protein